MTTDELITFGSEKLLTASEVAGILNVSKPHAYRLMQHGNIRTVRMFRSVRVRKQDLEEFIASHLDPPIDFSEDS